MTCRISAAAINRTLRGTTGNTAPISRPFRGLRLGFGTLAALTLVILGAAGARAAERSLTDASGEQVTVPQDPQRVITLSEPDLDAALALGVEPVGTVAGRGQAGPPRYLGERAASVEVIGQFMHPSMGRIIELQPDLILAGGVPDPQLIAQLRRVAPAVVTYQIGESWRQALQGAAEALHRQAEAEAFLARYRERATAVEAALGQHAGASVSIVRWNPRGPAYMQRDAFASRVIRDAGLRRPDHQQEPGTAHTPPLSLEALERIDADWIFVGTLQPAGEAVRALEQARDMPAFQALNAVQAGHVVSVDGSLWTGPGGPLGALAILADVEEAMAPR
ncbi:ABC transporter substrate-binding protein [Arhodomonas sp. AD133]|uniref:ABC transporter substrate-binding protein n=1 Tax=Arhodomonas sp. AD133 TaxID=3415009 RepID=UPI003EBA5505